MDLLKPMLSEAPKAAAKKLEVDGWVAQQKLDGVRLMVHVDEGNVIPVNRDGAVIAIPLEIAPPFAAITSGQFVFDGEFVGGVFWLFDLPVADDRITPTSPYRHRLAVLEQFYQGWNPAPMVQLVPTAHTTGAKKRLSALLRLQNAEGMILKNLDGKYTPGIRSGDCLKHKFWESCEVIITEVGRDDKENAVMSMIDVDKGIVEVGTVSCIGKGEIGPGDVVEVKYLYAVNPDKPSLYQPSIQRVRDDKPMGECTVDQIKYTNKRVIPPEETGLSAEYDKEEVMEDESY